MKCAKCNRRLGIGAEFCTNCGTAVPPAPAGQKKKSWINFFIWLGMIVLLTPTLYYFATHGSNATRYTAQENLWGSLAVAFLAASLLYLIYRLIYHLVKFTIRRPVWGSILIVMFVVWPAVGGFFYLQGGYLKTQFQTAVAGIQQQLDQTADAKLAGDLLAAKKPVAGMTIDNVQNQAAQAAKNLAALKVPDSLKNYQAVAIIWSLQVASTQTADWKGLTNQPADFPLALNQADASSTFAASLQIIDNLKKDGADAISKKDRVAMRTVAAKLLIQEHWLNAVLHSNTNSTALNFALPAFADTGLQPVPDVKGVNVTCSVCDYPDAYKVHWTDSLRKLYGCDTACHPKIRVLQTGGGGQQQVQTQNQSQASQPTANNPATDNELQYATALTSYTYANVPTYTICMGYNGTATRTSGTNGYCLQDAVQSTNEIAASAIGFSESTKSLTVNQWDNEYQQIDLALQPPANETGAAPSKPAITNGHTEGGMGTVSNGSKDRPILNPNCNPFEEDCDPYSAPINNTPSPGIDCGDNAPPSDIPCNLRHLP